MEGFVFYLKEARRSQVHNGSVENDSIICPLKEALVAPKALFKLKPVKGGGAQGSLESYEKSGVRFPISLPRPHPWPRLHPWDDPVVGPYRWGLNAALYDSGLSVPEKGPILSLLSEVPPNSLPSACKHNTQNEPGTVLQLAVNVCDPFFYDAALPWTLNLIGFNFFSSLCFCSFFVKLQSGGPWQARTPSDCQCWTSKDAR